MPGDGEGVGNWCLTAQSCSLGRGKALEKEMATHSSILVWKIPWTEEPGGLQSKDSDTSEWVSTHEFTTLCYWSSGADEAQIQTQNCSTLGCQAIVPLTLGLLDSEEWNNFICISRGKCGLGELFVKIRRIQGSMWADGKGAVEMEVEDTKSWIS